MPNYSPALPTIRDTHFIDRGWHFLVNHLVQDVPDSIAVCEFDCRETDCSMERWISCERRLRTEQCLAGSHKHAA